MCWRNEVIEVPKPSHNSVDTWIEFTNWMHQQKIETKVAFAQRMQCKYEMLITDRHAKKIENNNIEHYETT